MSDTESILYIKKPDPKGSVFVFDKSPEHKEKDLAEGVARIGGAWSRLNYPARANPDYAIAYVQAARVLVDAGREKGTYDDVGLPALYLQRHAVELLIKQLLSLLYDEVSLRSAQCCNCQGEALDLREMGHDLHRLLKELKNAGERLKYTAPPNELDELVEKIKQFEETGTCARYPSSQKKDKDSKKYVEIHHFRNETRLPIVELQERLEAVVPQMVFQCGGDTYVNQIADGWESAARDAGIFALDDTCVERA